MAADIAVRSLRRDRVRPASGLYSKRKRTLTGLAAPGVALIGLTLGWPLIFAIAISFRRFSAISMYTSDWTLSNYAELAQPFVMEAAIRTTLIAITTTCVCVLLAYPVAYTIARATPRAGAILVYLLIIPMLAGQIIQVYGLTIALEPGGPISSVLQMLGLADGPVNLLGHNFSVVIGLVNALLPFMVLTLMSSIKKISPSLEGAARVHGASPLQLWRRVLVPLSVPGIVSGSLLVFALSMGSLVTPTFLGGPSDQTLSMLVVGDMLATLNWPKGTATAVFLILITVVGALTLLVLTSRIGYRRAAVR